MANSSYQDLTVWQKSVDLAVLIYKITNKFPKHELYNLVSQLRKAAVAIASNIAEGQGRGSKKEFRQFIRIAYGSILELETQLIIATRIKYLSTADKAQIFDLTEQIKRMLYKLEKSLNVK